MVRKKRKLPLSVIMIVLVMTVLAPVVIWFIYSAFETQKLMLSGAQNSMQAVVDAHAQNLAQKISSISSYNVELTSPSGDIFKMATAENETNFIVYFSSFSNVSRNHMGSYEDADVFYCYSKNYNRSFTRTRISGYDESIVAFFDEFAPSRQASDPIWSVHEIDGKKWLICSSVFADIVYCQGVNLENIVQDVAADINNEKVTVYITERETNEDMGMVKAQSYLTKAGLYLNAEIRTVDLIMQLPLLNRFNISITVIAIIVIPILLFFLRIYVINPMKTVNSAMEALKKDAFYRIDQNARSYDFDVAFSSFNSMADEIVDLRIRNYEQELGSRQLQLENLELQMNPHFLMNTFNLIYNLAQMKEFGNIQKMVLYLSDYFRILNSKNHTGITVLEEITLIRKYLETAKIQYIDRFTYEIDVDEELDDYEIPVLLLHNFVENFIKHGITFDRECKLWLRGKRNGENVVFTIADNGRGLSSEIAEKINNGDFDLGDGRHHFGMRNNFLRVRYQYKEKGSIHIESEIDKGMKVTVTLPYSVEDNDEASDSK